jgi:AcrR family transcriptional regulator
MAATDRREVIVRAARAEFCAHGLDRALTKNIARSAGVVESVLYDHFGSKSAMFEAAVLEPLEAAVRTMVEGAAAIAALDDDRRIESLRSMHAGLLEAMIGIAPLLRVAMSAQVGGDEQFYAQRIGPLIDDLIEATRTALPGWSHQDIPAEIIVYAVIGTHLVLASEANLRGLEIDLPTQSAQVAELIFYGLVDRPASGA